MIEQIKNHPDLKPFLSSQCEENHISASMEADISPGNYVVIKVDNFYNSLRLGDTPPSIDCLIPLKCSDGSFMIYLIELKNIKSPRGFKVKNILGKFKTSIHDFMEKRFKDIFIDGGFNIKNINSYFVTNPYRESKFSSRPDNTKMDFLLSQSRPIRFNGRLISKMIQERPNLIIKNC